MKVAFASMTYGPVDPRVLPHQRVASWHATKHGGVEWVGDISPNRMKFDVGRNRIAKDACDLTDADYVFWCDSDIMLPQDAITRMVSHGDPFVTGIYFQREGSHWPLIANRLPNEGSFQWLIKWPEGAYFPADGCGFGCVLTSVEMLKDIGDNWFTYEKYSEDFDFCIKAKAKGYQLHVDSNVLCGHLGDAEPVTFETYKAAHPKFGHPIALIQTGEGVSSAAAGGTR